MATIRNPIEFQLATIEDKLTWLTKHGISVVLNWSEDNDLWECSWIDDSGDRYTGFSKLLSKGINECFKKWVEKYPNRFNL